MKYEDINRHPCALFISGTYYKFSRLKDSNFARKTTRTIIMCSLLQQTQFTQRLLFSINTSASLHYNGTVALHAQNRIIHKKIYIVYYLYFFYIKRSFFTISKKIRQKVASTSTDQEVSIFIPGLEELGQLNSDLNHKLYPFEQSLSFVIFFIQFNAESSA